MKTDKKISVSFDFDDTLSVESIKSYAKELIDNGVDVWVVTSRFDSWEKCDEWQKKNDIDLGYEWDNNKEVWEVVDEIGLSRDKVVFVNFEWKKTYFIDKPEFIWHLDDSRSEVKRICESSKTIGIICTHTWKNKCNRILKKMYESA